ncbi:MAG TPA: hypothetical protein VEU62_07720, partial [Bryobacterales bacterium]|nr:hypothetical protein [Bryobacterales bacterium]
GHLPSFQFLKFPWPDLPEPYDPQQELRIQVSEYTPDNRLEKIMIVLRGPWAFGSSLMDSASLALGNPAHRGRAYLLYELSGGRVELTLLFNVGRLGTIVLAPNACGPDAVTCQQPYRWGLSKDQTEKLSLTYEPPPESSADGMFQDSAAGITYLVRPAEGRQDEWQVRAIYVQRNTKEVANPTLVRSIGDPDLKQTDHQPSLSELQYARVLEKFRQGIAFRQRSLGPENSWVLYQEFEMGRMQIESGHAEDGRTVILVVVGVLERRLGPKHPDVLAMRAWAGPDPKASARRRRPAR